MSEAILEKLRSVSALYNQKKRLGFSQSQETIGNVLTQSSTQQVFNATRYDIPSKQDELRESVPRVTTRWVPDPEILAIPTACKAAPRSVSCITSSSMQTETTITLDTSMQTTVGSQRGRLGCLQSDMILCQSDFPSVHTAVQTTVRLDNTICRFDTKVQLFGAPTGEINTQTDHYDSSSFVVGEILKKLDQLSGQVASIATMQTPKIVDQPDVKEPIVDDDDSWLEWLMLSQASTTKSIIQESRPLISAGTLATHAPSEPTMATRRSERLWLKNNQPRSLLLKRPRIH